MYKTLPAARAALAAEFGPEMAQDLLELLVPCLVFETVEGDAAPGATRIGGLPDLPPDIAWPVRPVPANVEDIIERGGSYHAKHYRAHIMQALPYQFAAQIDLAEAARLGDPAQTLPEEGRLLFFFDGSVGPWHNSTDMCRVIWDRSPVESLVRATRPDLLTELGEKYHREWSAISAKLGRPAPAPDDVPYWGPARAMRLAIRFCLPDNSSIEAAMSERLAALLQEDDFETTYFDSVSESWLRNEDLANRQQLLGSPHCEQSDPRYDAVASNMAGGGCLSGEKWRAAWPRIEAEAADWVLLLQLDLSDYLQQYLTEGTFYFVIPEDALAARDFDKVVAVYQQT